MVWLVRNDDQQQLASANYRCQLDHLISSIQEMATGLTETDIRRVW